MALAGCQEGKATPKLVEVECPCCHGVIEVFVHMGGSANKTGRTAYDEECFDCGEIIPAGTSLDDLKKL